MEQGLELRYFCLKPNKLDAFGKASRAAMLTYADTIESANGTLANDLRAWVKRVEPAMEGTMVGKTVHDGALFDLILLPGEFEGSWSDAQAWATERGGVLPSRIDQLVLFQHARAEFKREWYWSSEPYADNTEYAWCQPFTSGYQYCHLKGAQLRARAVRRVPIR